MKHLVDACYDTKWRLDGGEAGDSDIVDSNPLGNGIGVVLVGCMNGDAAPMSLSTEGKDRDHE